MTEQGKIEQEGHSYRRGMVLGLTMAETMILLAFCLLLAAGTLLKRQHDQLNLARIQLETLKATAAPVDSALRDYIELSIKMSGALTNDGSIDKSMIDDFWKEIIEGKDALSQLEGKGLSKEELKNNAEFLSAVMDMKDKGETLDSLKANSVVADAIARFQKASGLEPNNLKGTLAKLDELSKQAQAANGKDEKGHKWPPMISLSEAGGYFFKLGSAELSPEFERRLQDVVIPSLVKMAQEYDVDVIEVVGHTDELPIGSKGTNLDKDMVEVLKGSKPIVALKPGDNAGLGIARSVSVVRNLLHDPRLNGLRVLPLSGAQLIKTDETLANGTDVQGDVKERRRIEIRLRKSTPPETPKSGPDLATVDRG